MRGPSPTIVNRVVRSTRVPIADEQLTEDFVMSSPRRLDQHTVLTLSSVLSRINKRASPGPEPTKVVAHDAAHGLLHAAG